MNLDNGSIRLFRIAGIDVLVHWSWAIAAIYFLKTRADGYTMPLWNVAEYLSLFGIVLLHEFGHALACRQVGGKADRIVLWPLGGIAYVKPPPRPGAVLWSIAAGPLVNVLLVPATLILHAITVLAGWADSPDVSRFVDQLFWINLVLLIFNLIPVYPLDGGQIVQALLWFIIGRVYSLMTVSIIGLVVGGALIVVTLAQQNWWFAIIAVFVAMQSLNGFRVARLLAQRARAPRHNELHCPSCGMSPLAGSYWRCSQCGDTFDTFANRAACPNCGQRFPITACTECGERHPIEAWGIPKPAEQVTEGPVPTGT
jgi:Zn-dependent protease